MPRSRAIVGNATVVKPLSSVLMPVMSVTDVITVAVWPFVVTDATLSRLVNEGSSYDATWLSVDPIVDGRRKLLARVAAASGGAIA